MGNQPDQPWNPYNLDTEEHRTILGTSETIDKAMERTQKLAVKLADDGSLPEQDVRWLIHMTYSALLEVWTAVRLKEYRAHLRQEQSQSTAEILAELREIPPYEPIPVPDWLAGLQPQKGG